MRDGVDNMTITFDFSINIHIQLTGVKDSLQKSGMHPT